MISVDWSILPAIFIFILTVVALNYLLVKPIMRVQEEREMKTAGLIAQTRQNLAHHLQLFDQYQATIKNARMEGYRLVEKARADALLYRSGGLERARKSAERLILAARDLVKIQVNEAKVELGNEAEDMARRITSAILRRSA
jgi:F-type H+-transporting ATPase subunit b